LSLVYLCLYVDLSRRFLSGGGIAGEVFSASLIPRNGFGRANEVKIALFFRLVLYWLKWTIEFDESFLLFRYKIALVLCLRCLKMDFKCGSSLSLVLLLPSDMVLVQKMKMTFVES
jgi:hypothetical protein